MPLIYHQTLRSHGNFTYFTDNSSPTRTFSFQNWSGSQQVMLMFTFCVLVCGSTHHQSPNDVVLYMLLMFVQRTITHRQQEIKLQCRTCCLPCSSCNGCSCCISQPNWQPLLWGRGSILNVIAVPVLATTILLLKTVDIILFIYLFIWFVGAFLIKPKTR